LENLSPKLIPQEQRYLKYSTKLAWGERNLEVLTRWPREKGVGMPWGDLVPTKRTGWFALWRLGRAAEKGTKSQPSCHLEQGATLSSSFCLVHEKKR